MDHALYMLLLFNTVTSKTLIYSKSLDGNILSQTRRLESLSSHCEAVSLHFYALSYLIPLLYLYPAPPHPSSQRPFSTWWIRYNFSNHTLRHHHLNPPADRSSVFRHRTIFVHISTKSSTMFCDRQIYNFIVWKPTARNMSLECMYYHLPIP